MLFNEEFINNVQEDPINGVVKACELALSAVNEVKTSEHEWNEIEHEILWEAASFLSAVIEQEGFTVPADFPKATGNIATNCSRILEYIKMIENHFNEQSVLLNVQSYTSRYKTSLKSSFAYEFSQGDLERIQTLINELRTQISEQKSLEEDHKQRLLRRLEKLQAELHKRVSDLDRFWGLVGEAGVVLGKLGDDAKPIVDRAREIAEIIWKTQARTEELSSDIRNPVLENDEKSSS